MIMILLFYVLSPFAQGPPIGGQDRDGASYRCSAPYTLSRFAGLPLKGKRENRWHWILCPYDTDSQSRNADFISIARRAIRNPQRRSRCRPLSGSEHNLSTQPAAKAAPLFLTLRRQPPPQPSGPSGPSNLRTFFQSSFTQPAADRWPQPSGRSPVNLPL